MSGKILVTGGAGYVGSHVCKVLSSKGYDVLVFDNFSTGHKEFVQWGEFIEGDIQEYDEIHDALGGVDAVVHCAALARVDESISIEDYYDNNLIGTLNLLSSMHDKKVRRIIYTSTMSGHESLYGSTKRMAERIITQFYKKCGIEYGILRLQNVAGASPDGDIGEWHDPETHLIANACLAALGKKDKLEVYGNGYAQRDYVHVMDVAEEIVSALEGGGNLDSSSKIESGGKTFFKHVGSGILRSVRSVIEQVAIVSGNNIRVEYTKARNGDAYGAEQVAVTEQRRNINEIIESALKWHNR